MKRIDPHHYFTSRLMQWNRAHNRREMPWKGERDPYKIWLSEIILQQTRVEQGLGYYQRFIEAFPTVQHLAAAPDDQVFKLWEGLGYYSRCRNLLKAARWMATEHNGRFPDTPEAIRSLPGVGPYTAAAIGSFAFNLPLAVVDGNVYRVLARYFGIRTPFDSSTGKKQFAVLAQQLLDTAAPGTYNQALMDFGATLCKPRNPACGSCPLRSHCVALQENSITELPVKSKVLVRKNRWFYFLVAEYRGRYYVRKRTAKDIWQHLYEFIAAEGDGPLSSPPDLQQAGFPDIPLRSTPLVSGVYRQQLTHQTVNGQFILVQLNAPLRQPGAEAVSKQKIRELPFPKLITAFLQDKTVSLNLS